jgi:hypothetical protein
MPDKRDQQKQQGVRSGQQHGGGGQKSGHPRQQPSQKHEQGGQQRGSGLHMSTDQISFYDESLK